MNDLSIRTKLLASFGALLIVIVLLGFFAVWRMSSMNDKAAEIRNDSLPSAAVMGQLVAELETVRIKETEYILASTDAARNGVDADWQKAIDNTAALRAKYTPLISAGTEDERLMRQFDEAWGGYKGTFPKLRELVAKADDKGTLDLFNGESGRSYTAARQASLADLNFSINQGTEQADEGAAVFNWAWWAVIFAIVVSAVLCIGLVLFAFRAVVQPLTDMTDSMRRLAQRDLNTEIVGLGRGDEIGGMAQAVQVFKSSMIEADRLGEQQRTEAAAREKRAKSLEQLTNRFGEQVGLLVQTLSHAAGDMQGVASSMSATASHTNEESVAGSAAAEQTTANVQTVAVATEELTSSIHEIGRQVLQSSKIANEAVEHARRTDATVQALAEGAQRIGEVVTLIKSIAGQTNLLALNATIEAARAGEAGRGFSVVASEVKSLAAQTAKATDEIAGQVESIQSATAQAVEAIHTIGRTISDISAIASTIASAVEEQGAATQEIARNVQEAAQGTQVVAGHITSVRNAAGQTGAAAGQVLSASADLRQPGYSLAQPFYTSPEIFETDLDVIFGRHWIYVGVEPDVPEPGDVRCWRISAATRSSSCGTTTCRCAPSTMSAAIAARGWSTSRRPPSAISSAPITNGPTISTAS
jgi:methyl-accepting chemotaxis protein